MMGIRTVSVEPGLTEGRIGSSNKLLIAALVAALLPRIAMLLWALRQGVPIDSEGAEYTRIAQNLIAGHGYVGIFNNGIQLNFPPLFPFLIAALSFVLPSTELAARLVNVVLGSALVIPMFKVAERIYNRKVAIIVSALVAFHPLLITRSITAGSETPYFTFLMAGLYCVMRWVDVRQRRTCILAGVCFGLAYLTRPEAFLIVGALAAAGILWGYSVDERRTAFMGVLSLVGVFLLVASPYIAFLSIHSGKFRIEGKGSIAYAWGKKVNEGMSYDEAATKVGDDLSPQGVFMQSNYDALRNSPYTPGDMLWLVLRTASRNLKRIYFFIAEAGPMGVPMLIVLAVLGLLRTPWDHQRVVKEGILICCTGLVMVLALLTLQWLWPRYFHSLLGLLLLWAGKGAEELYHWSHDTVAGFAASDRLPKIVGLAVQWTAVLAVIATSLSTVPKDPEFEQFGLTERKMAGQWIAQQSPAQPWVMSSSLIPAYYANGNFMYLPYSSSETALRYISKKKPDFLVLNEYPRTSLPYLTTWFDAGIPDSRAVMVYDHGEPDHERVKIYRWSENSMPGH
jgi:4-amino-4-deoxy-L-arabinose transferase-like glycosyltransferase